AAPIAAATIATPDPAEPASTGRGAVGPTRRRTRAGFTAARAITASHAAPLAVTSSLVAGPPATEPAPALRTEPASPRSAGPPAVASAEPESPLRAGPRPDTRADPATPPPSDASAGPASPPRAGASS